MGQNGFSAVGSLFSDRLLVLFKIQAGIRVVEDINIQLSLALGHDGRDH